MQETTNKVSGDIDRQSILAFEKVERDFAGEAQRSGFNSECEMQDYMLDIRREVRGY